jgi:osmoprotectant transport system ATP-binding protein
LVTISTNAGPSVEFIAASRRYGDAMALDTVSLSIPGGQFVALVGASGSGKSTLVKLVNRLVEPSSGQVLVGGADVAESNAVTLRRSIGYVFQNIGLFAHMTAAQNIAIGARIAGNPIDAARIAELLAQVALPADFADRYPDEISGGQAQRIGVARALACGASLLLMDEPFGALDPVTREALGREVRSLHDRLGLTTIMVTHDMAEALLVADRIVVLDRGRVVADAAPAALLRNPGHPVAEALVAVPRAQAHAIAAMERST